MTPRDRISRFLSVAGIDRPAERTIQGAKGKATVTIDLEPSELAQGYESAAAKLFGLLDNAEKARDLTISTAKVALARAVEVGEYLLEMQDLFAGEYDEWLVGYCSGRISRATAYRYTRAVRYRDVLGDECPDFASLKELYVAAGIMPPPDSAAGAATRAPEPLFRLRCEINLPPDPSKWEPVVRRDFIAKAKPVAELLEKALAAEENAQ